jgi:eukaryotic-like serine/threonine-protein kinase
MAARFSALVPGDPAEVAGYVLRARLGTGGMGTVYLSFSRGGRPVAIKVVKREFADDPEFRRRFAREIAAAQQVQGHFTAPVVDADPDGPVPWLATAYIAGPSLQSAVAEHGPFPLFTVFRLLAGAAEGIANVHQVGLIHRDLKPGNVLLAADGPRVIDFGIAHAANSSTLTGKGTAIGTPGYMAPEQIRGKVTEATDVFGVGHLAVFAATGHAAFGEGITETLFYRILNEPPDLDGCPAELRPIVERCLAKEPADRPAIGEVIDYARDAMRGETMRVLDEPWLPPPVAATLRDYNPSAAPHPPTVSVRPAPPSPTAPPKPRKRLLRPALVIPAVLILAVGGYLGYLIGGSHGSGDRAGGTGNPGATQSAPATGTTTAPRSGATQGASSPPASAASSQAGSPAPGPAQSADAGYPQEWAARQFTMPGGNCSSVSYPSSVTFDVTKGPVVVSTADSPSGDLYYDCSNGSSPSGVSFNGNQAAQVSGSPGAAACDHAITTTPLPNQDVPWSKLIPGVQFCTVDTQSGQLVLLTLQSADSGNGNLTWQATAWSLSS